MPKSRFQQIKEKLIKNPHNSQAHLALAEKFLKNNQFPQAEKELQISQKEKENDQQLQALLLKKHRSDPQDIKKLITAWKKIAAAKPNYRDAYLQLAILYYQIYKQEEAQRYLQKALALDPNFKLAHQLEEIFH